MRYIYDFPDRAARQKDGAPRWRCAAVLLAALLITGCRHPLPAEPQPSSVHAGVAEESSLQESPENGDRPESPAPQETSENGNLTEDAVFLSGSAPSSTVLPLPETPREFDLASVPAFDGTAWADVNGDVPFFTEEEMEAAGRLAAEGSMAGSETVHRYQVFGPLDGLGRCIGACALAGPETLPQEGRGNISSVKPTGWHTVRYDIVENGYLYNRCHLIGFQLTGENANEQNLITGTRFMNTEGMLPYEDSVLAYIRGTGKHVLYRVTPVFEGENLLAAGVLMEARSVEDPLVQFCAFCYNVQPGIEIEYASGESREREDPAAEAAGTAGDAASGGNVSSPADPAGETAVSGGDDAPADRVRNAPSFGGKEADNSEWTYVVNVRSGIFHRPECDSVEKISSKNRQDFDGSREELIDAGYRPCKSCRP